MKKNLSLVFAALILFACNSNKETKNTATQLDEYLTAQSTHYRFNGNVLVAENGKIVFQKSYGYADVDTRRMVNDSSPP